MALKHSSTQARLGSLAIILLAVTKPIEARAQSGCPFVPPGVPVLNSFTVSTCQFLPRSPVFLDKDTVTRCELDEDGNGLDDEIERQIASCVVPLFKFDSDEPADSLLPGEPVVGYTSWRISAPGFGVRIRFRFVALFRRDGGFASDDAIQCGDAHDGDSQNFTIDVTAFKDGGWRFELADVKFAFTGPCTAPHVIGMHPVVYPSAGKHHWYSDPGVSINDVSGPGSCKEGHRGNGAQRLPTSLFKVAWNIGLGPGVFFNECAVVASGGTQFPFAKGLQEYKLDNLGFADQTLYSKFYQADPIIPLVDGSFTPDADGDGLPEISAWNAADAKIDYAPTDPCVLDPTNPPDEDGDGLSGRCDEDPYFKQTYVGLGTPTQPAVPIVSSSWYGFSSMRWGGFLDRDQDSSPDGVDECPILKPAGSNTMGGVNRWGEDANWPPDPVTNNQLGLFQRGSTCDPQPVALSTWKSADPSFKQCAPPGFYPMGNDQPVKIDTMIGRGISANDPFWDAPKLELPKSFSYQTRRCACRSRTSGAPLDGSACLLNPDSECFRADSSPTPLSAGRGWIPVDRPACARDAASFCAAGATTLGRPSTVKTGTSWDWRREAETYCPSGVCAGNATPHFTSDDIEFVNPPLGQPPVPSLTHEYAVWTLVDLESHLGIPTTRPGAFVDPEYHALGTALQDPTSPPSVRIRSSFFEKPISRRTGQHDAFYVGLDCALNTLQAQLTRVHLWFGPDPVSPVRMGFADVRLLAHDGSVLGNLALLRPADHNASRVSLSDIGDAGWLTDESVHVVPLSRRPGVIFPGPGFAAALAGQFGDPGAEPDLLAVERSDGVPRWARLSAIQVEPALVHYAVTNQGTLRGAVSSSAVLVADSAGSSAALVDPATGVLEAYAPQFGLWARLPLPEPLIGRTESAVGLWGSNLLVAGGAQDASPSGDLWQVDLEGAGSSLLRQDLPARRGALLQVAPSGQSVLLAGGMDSSNARHDDVWQLSVAGLSPREFAPVLRFADTSQAALFDPRTVALVVNPYGSELSAVSFEAESPTRSATMVRTTSGWQPAGDSGDPLQCSVADETGGELCPLGSAWWAGPGRRPCESAPSACEGSAGVVLASAAIPGWKPVTDADVDDSSVWVARKKVLERWSIDTQFTPTLAASAALPSKPSEVRTGDGGALVATRDGAVFASSTPEGFAFGPPLPLCGRPLHIEPIANGVWAVATSLGLALIESHSGDLNLLSMSLLLPFGPQSQAVVPLGIGAAATAACKAATAWMPDWVEDALAHVTALASDSGTLLVASGPRLYRLDVRDPLLPVLQTRVALGRPLRAMRFDTVGGRAYGLEGGSHNWLHGTDKSLIVDLRGGGLHFAGAHSVPDWVDRRDAGQLSARLTQWHQVQLAKVAR